MSLHKNWKFTLPLILTDYVYWISDQGIGEMNISSELIKTIKYRIKIILANIGIEEFKRLCAKDGFHLSDQWFEQFKE